MSEQTSSDTFTEWGVRYDAPSEIAWLIHAKDTREDAEAQVASEDGQPFDRPGGKTVHCVLVSRTVTRSPWLVVVPGE